MKAPHKSIMECVAKDASRYSMNGTFVSEVTLGDGKARAAWCATDGRMLACEALSEANAQEVRDDPRGYANTLFDVADLARMPIFRVDGTKMIGTDGAAFPLREATVPDVDHIMRDVVRSKRCAIEVDADFLLKALAVAVAETRKGAKEERGKILPRAVVLSFQVHDDVETGCDPQDVLVETSPILVRPLDPARAERFAAVIMPIGKSHEEDKEAEKRGKARERSRKAMEKRIADLEAQLALACEALAEAQAQEGKA